MPPKTIVSGGSTAHPTVTRKAILAQLVGLADRPVLDPFFGLGPARVRNPGDLGVNLLRGIGFGDMIAPGENKPAVGNPPQVLGQAPSTGAIHDPFLSAPLLHGAGAGRERTRALFLLHTKPWHTRARPGDPQRTVANLGEASPTTPYRVIMDQKIGDVNG